MFATGSDTAEGPRDALCQLKSLQLLHSCIHTTKFHLKRLAIDE